MSSKHLTLKKQQFIRVYIKTGNATEAAMQVYNTKKRTIAAQIGYENLRKPDVRQAIKGYFERVDHVPVYVAEAFVDVLKNGTMDQRLNASIAYFKIMGLYPK